MRVNGVLAPLLSVTSARIYFQVPSGIAAGAAEIEVRASDRVLASATAEVAAWSPGIFLTNSSSLDRPGAILTEDYSLTSSGTRAQLGRLIRIYGTGAAVSSLQPSSGATATVSPLATATVLPRVFVGSDEVHVETSALVPGDSGLWQIDVRLPDTPSLTGIVPVVVLAPGGYASNPATIWIE